MSNALPRYLYCSKFDFIGKLTSADVVKLDSATTVEGSTVKFDASNGVKVNNATVVTLDVEADNGVIHVIDTVLIPA